MKIQRMFRSTSSQAISETLSTRLMSLIILRSIISIHITISWRNRSYLILMTATPISTTSQSTLWSAACPNTKLIWRWSRSKDRTKAKSNKKLPLSKCKKTRTTPWELRYCWLKPRRSLSCSSITESTILTTIMVMAMATTTAKRLQDTMERPRATKMRIRIKVISNLIMIRLMMFSIKSKKKTWNKSSKLTKKSKAPPKDNNRHLMMEKMKKVINIQQLNFRSRILSSLCKNRKWSRYNSRRKMPNKAMVDLKSKSKSMNESTKKVLSL